METPDPPLTDRQAWILRRALIGAPLNGEVEELAGSLALVTRLLLEAPPPLRPQLAEAYLRTHPDPIGFCGALERVDPDGPIPEAAEGEGDGSPGPRPKLINPAEVEEKAVEWLWDRRIPTGVLTTFTGDPKRGKSLAALDIAARVTNGARMPDGSPGVSGSVLILAAEDDLARTLVPRLRLAEADLGRVRILEATIDVDGREQFPDLRRDLPALERALDRMGDCRLVIVDPITAYLGGMDQNDGGQVRSVLGPLKLLAERRGAAVVLISHFAKGDRGSALKKVSGSIAFTAAARANFGFLDDPECPGRRLMLPIGCNLADPPGMAYRIEVRPRSERPGDAIAVIEWESAPVHADADELLQAARERPEEREERTGCERWLGELLRDGPVPAQEVQRQAKGAGFAWRTLERVKGRLKVRSVRRGFGKEGRWAWALPGAADADEAPGGPTDPKAAISPEAADRSPKGAIDPGLSSPGASPTDNGPSDTPPPGPEDGEADLWRALAADGGDGGRGDWWRCPFHPDRNPSLTARGDRWHCFGCGAGGDAPAFVMRHAGLTFPEALAELGLGREPGRKARRRPAVPARREEETDPPEAWRHAAARIAAEGVEALWGPEGREALAYLAERRFLAPETIRAANLGFNPAWRRLPELTPPGASRPPSLAPGIVIPWMGADGEGIGLINVRRLDGGEPKYRALPGSRRGGIYPGPRAVRLGLPLIACEGEFDCLLLAQALGASASVVTLGSASAVPSVGSRVALLLAARRYAATDADAAGDEAAVRWLGPRAMRVLPPGGCKDWTEAFAAGHDPGASWRRVLAGGEASFADEAREDPTLPHRITLPADPGLRARVLALSERGREAWDERAAIAEYDGNLPRGEAERLAYALTLRGRGP